MNKDRTLAVKVGWWLILKMPQIVLTASELVGRVWENQMEKVVCN